MSAPAPRRRALLLGVPRQDSKYITSLKVVENDLECVAAALRTSRYEVELINLADKSEFAANSLRRRIRKFCEDPDSKGATLLLYFSGHGIHWEGKNWLVAGDAHPDNLHELRAGLLEADQAATFDDCEARTILFMVDACREGVDYPTKGLVLKAWSRDHVRSTASQRRATIYSCGLGQLSRFHMPEDGKSGYSLFSKALSEVMDAGHPARSMRDVVNALEEGVLQLCRQHRYERQDVRVATEGADDDPIWSECISDGPAAETVASPPDPWVRAAEESGLWKGLDETQARPFRTAAVRTVGACALQRDAVVRASPDGWEDAQWPLRVLKLVEFLAKKTEPALVLSPAETWLLVAAPFVAQAVRDAAVVALGVCSHPPRHEVERIHNAMPQLARKATRLRETGFAEQAASVEGWLLRRAARASSRSWTFSEDASSPGHACAPGGEQGLLPASLWTGVAPDEPLLEMRPEHWRTRLFALARLVDADSGWRDREDLPAFLNKDEALAPGSADEQPLRGALLGWLLALSSRMAFDVMTLGEVVVDHIGLSDPVTPAQAVEHCQRLRWLPHGDGRNAELECEHPALDKALRDAIAQADALLARLHLRRTQGLDGLTSAAPWPRALHDQGVQPARRAGRVMYQTPHVTFQLAHQEVRELLMGQQLYGDPTLAIRELYQNALDACRYRRARLQYLARSGHPALDPWRGGISFKQYRDERGRLVLECLDNGIGMGRRELEKAFASVGKRFADMPEFIDEKAAWQRLDPPIQLYPNSRFGIGVLSYFMLADELELVTRRVAMDGGMQGPALHITVSGSGSLFRIRDAEHPQDEARVRAGGTLVRLYMNRSAWTDSERAWAGEQPISCTRTLLELLYRSEFDVTATHHGGPNEDTASHEWKAGKLSERNFRSSSYFGAPASNEAWIPGAADAPVWWHPGRMYTDQGIVLCDGIATETRLFGCTIDLRDANRPRLTVDRRKVIELDTALVDRLCLEAIPALVPPPAWLDMRWLWDLAGSVPAAARVLGIALDDGKHALPLYVEPSGLAAGARIEIAQVGLVAADGLIFAAMNALSANPDTALSEINSMSGALPAWLLPRRIAMWRDLGMHCPEDARLPNLPAENVPPFRLDATDLEMLRRNAAYSFEGGWRAHIDLCRIVAWASRLDETLESTHARFARWEGMGLQVAPLAPSLRESTPDKEVGRLLTALETIVDREADPSAPALEMDLMRLAEIATGLDITLGRAHAALAPYASAIDIDLEDVPPAAAGLRLDIVDRKLLSVDIDGRAPWMSGMYLPDRVLKIASTLSMPTHEVVHRLEALVPLGIQVPMLSRPALDAPPWTPIVKYMPKESDRFGWTELLHAAAGLSLPLSAALSAAALWGWQPDAEAREAAERRPDYVPDALLQALFALEEALSSPASTRAELSAAWLTPGSLRLAAATRRAGAPAAVQQARIEAIAALLGAAAPTPPWDALADTEKLPDDALEALAFCIEGDPADGIAEVAAWRIALVAGGLQRSLAQADADLRSVLDLWGTRIAPLPELSAEFLAEPRTFVPPELWVIGPDGNGKATYDPRLTVERLMKIVVPENSGDIHLPTEAAKWKAFGVTVVEGDPQDEPAD